MADKNYQMRQRNSDNTDWDLLYPVTKVDNVKTNGTDSLVLTDGEIVGEVTDMGIVGTKEIKNLITIDSDTTTVPIGIAKFSADSDALTVYKDGIYLCKGINYNISSDGMSIELIKIEDSDIWENGSVFSFSILKNVLLKNDEVIGVTDADTVDGKHASDFATATHTHTKDEISDFPTSLPANGGNADTIAGYDYNRFHVLDDYWDSTMSQVEKLADVYNLDKFGVTQRTYVINAWDSGVNSQTDKIPYPNAFWRVTLSCHNIKEYAFQKWVDVSDNVGRTYYRYAKIDNSGWNDFVRIIDSETISNPNLLVNGGLQVWQRGNTFTDSNAGVKYYADRFFGYRSGYASGMSIYHFTNVNAIDEMCIRVTENFSNACVIGQTLDAETVASIRGKTVTFSFNLRWGSLNTYIPKMRVHYNTSKLISPGSAGNIQMIAKEVNNKHGRQSLTFTVPVDAIGLQIDLYFVLNSAESEEYLCTSEWKLEVGSVATQFSPRPYEEELVLCRRYYEEVDEVLVYTGQNNMYIGTVNYTVPKRINPTGKFLTFSNGNTFQTVYGAKLDLTATETYFKANKTSAIGFNTRPENNQIVGCLIAIDAEIY